MGDWVALILRVGEEHGFWPAGPRGRHHDGARYRPGASEVMALRVGHEKLTRETGWMPKVSWEEGVLQTIRWYADNQERWIGRVDWLPTGSRLSLSADEPRARHGGRGLPRLPPRRAARGDAATTSSSPRSADYDLRRETDVDRLFADTKPELVFHLAALAGGIGANRAEPGRFWYENLLMGAYVLEQSRLPESRSSSRSGRSASTRSSRRCRSARRISGTATRKRRTRPYGIAKKTHLVGGQAYRDQYGVNVIHLLPVNLYGPRDNFHLENAHVIPDLIRKMHESPRARSSSGATARRRASSSTSRTAPRASCSPRSATTAPSRSTSAPGQEISIRELVELVADVVGFRGRDPLGHVDAERPAAPLPRRLESRAAVRLPGQVPLREGLERTVAWYRASTPWRQPSDDD